MVKQKVNARDVIQSHPIAKELEADAKFALVCEYVDLYEELQGMTLVDFLKAYFASTATVAVTPDAEDEVDTAKPDTNGDARTEETKSEVRPPSMVGLRAVYRYPGRNILTDAAGITRDSGNTVSFTDVDGEPWSNVVRDKVFPIKPENRKEIHVTSREAKDLKVWLAGTPSKAHADGAVIANLTFEFDKHPHKITLAIINGKRPYVDRFVQLPDKGFEDDQKPTTRLFGEHAFRVKGVDYIIDVVSP